MNDTIGRPPDSNRRFHRAAIILTVVLLAQAGVFYGFSRTEQTPSYRPLDQFPETVGSWQLLRQGVMEPEIKEVLRADDYITRWYARKDNQIVDLFVAFFKSQRYGQAPHSPKNCLPGSGWVWTVSDQIPIDIAQENRTIHVNRYIVQKGDQKSVILYWYQSRDRVVASEYRAKMYVIADAMQYNRTDTALIRVEVPLLDGNSDAGTASGVDFVKSAFGTLREFLPK